MQSWRAPSTVLGIAFGRIEWTVLRVERNFYRDKIGTTATEFVRGTYNEASGDLSLRGYDKDDPLEIIGLDNYRLELSSGGDWLFGPTESGGDWGGRFLALRVRFSFASAASFSRKNRFPTSLCCSGRSPKRRSFWR